MIKFYKKLFYILLGVVLTLYIIYIRLIVIRAPRDLILFNSTYNYKLIFIMSMGIIISLFLVYKNMRIILEKKESNNIINQLITTLNKTITNSFNELFNFILFTFVKEPYEVCSLFAKKFYALFSKITEGIFIYINILLKFIILIVFLIDVFYFFRLNYFYKALILLCISICISIVMFILDKVANNLPLIESYLIKGETVDSVTKKVNLTFSASPGNENIDLDYTVEEYAICSKIRQYLDIYFSLNHYYLPRFNIIMHLLYLFGWLYILYHNFTFF